MLHDSQPRLARLLDQRAIGDVSSTNMELYLFLSKLPYGMLRNYFQLRLFPTFSKNLLKFNLLGLSDVWYFLEPDCSQSYAVLSRTYRVRRLN